MIVVKISTEKRKKNNKIAQKSQKSSLLLDFIFNNIYSTVNTDMKIKKVEVFGKSGLLTPKCYFYVFMMLEFVFMNQLDN